jgi:bifunctional DNase/RNase
MAREMKVVGLVMDQQTDSTVVVLKDLSSDTALPIFIGLLEATNIAAKLENIALPRPMTHDLLKNIMDQLGIEVDRVEISDLRDETFYAWIYLSLNDRETKIDARPSDALAIALRTGSRIYVSEKVIQKYETIMARNETETQDDEAKRWTEALENLSAEDFQRYKI